MHGLCLLVYELVCSLVLRGDDIYDGTQCLVVDVPVVFVILVLGIARVLVRLPAILPVITPVKLPSESDWITRCISHRSTFQCERAAEAVELASSSEEVALRARYARR